MIYNRYGKEAYIKGTESTRYLTRNGDRAYGKLISLIYDIGELTEIENMDDITETLDNIVEGL